MFGYNSQELIDEFQFVGGGKMDPKLNGNVISVAIIFCFKTIRESEILL